MAVRLIVNADDFGWSQGTNEAICVLHDEGLLTSTSLMVAGAAVREAVEQARRRPKLGVGLHMVLVHGPSLLPRKQVPHLVDSRGWFSCGPEQAGMRYTLLPACRRELRQELAAQFRAFSDFELPWSHVDSHLHFALTPVFFAAARDLARQYPVAGWRVPEDDWELYRTMDPEDAHRQRFLALQFRWLSGRQRAAARTLGWATTRWCLGLFRTGKLRADYLAALVRALPDGDYELHCHPDLSTEAGRAEFDALRSPEFRSALHDREVQLITYFELKETVR